MEDGIMDDGGLEGCIEEMRELAKDKSPYLGMEFPSEEAAYEFYNEYGRIVGFNIRKDYCNKSNKDGVMTIRKFVCCKERESEKDKRYTMIKNHRKILERYVLGRWRLDEKDCEVEEKNVIMDKDDSKLLILARYRYLCPRIVKLAIQASMHKPAYQLVDEGIKEFCVKVNNMMKGVENFGTKELDVDDPNFAQVKGIKKKDIGHKIIGQSRNTTNVKNSSSSQPQTISQSSNITNVQSLSQPHPQLINYGYNLLTRDTNSYSLRYPQSQSLSFQASHSPQSSQGISLNLAGHNPMETEFRNESSFDFSIYSQPPPQN
ncbi:protein FAR-RED IMPAIRED RESPONSE 1-like [Camellia sinensis]|uniref:protein FAR-RED IMPAIRED RESPONSE 1-like n=1 Tax=Camellia sinensis TaxID=4442 RepID=UPI001035DFB6|nr:protein FAR-RED IMPAIRED RESPONSE 1-like [Camellia sinensis]